MNVTATSPMGALSEGEHELLQRARAVAAAYGHPQIDLVSLALALLDYRPQIIRHWRAQGIDADAVRVELEKIQRAHGGNAAADRRFATSPAQLTLTTEVAELLRSWRAEAPGGDAARLGTTDVARNLLRGLPQRALAVAESRNGGDVATSPPSTPSRAQPSGDDYELPPVLADHARDLTELAARGSLDPLIGREREVEHVIRILSRKKKRNPVLVGDAGVGKTVIVEGVAQRICAGDVPKHLLDARLVALNLASLLGGTRYRGEFEARLHAIINEVVGSTRPHLLFLDEFHLVSRAGAAEGGMDMASLLLTVMARGEISVIGATTPEEFDEHVGRHGPLARRIQLVPVNEPDATETLRILHGVRTTYESFHGVRIDDSALRAAAALSGRRQRAKGRRMPDLALDAIDDACARAQLAPSGGVVVVVTAADVAAVATEHEGAGLSRRGRLRFARRR